MGSAVFHVEIKVMLRSLCCLGVLGLLAAQLPAADEKVELKDYNYKVGDRVRITDDDRTTTRTVIEVGGKRTDKMERTAKLTVYMSEALAVKDGEKKPVKIRRTYEKAEETKDGVTTRLPLDGKTVLIEKKGDKYTFAYADGKALDGKELEKLEKEFNKKDDDDDLEQFIPKRPLAPGETWTMDPAKLIKAMTRDKDKEPFTLDKKKVSGSGKLADVYTFGGHKYGVYDLQMEFPLTALSGENKIPLKAGSKMQMHMVADGNVDGSEPDGSATMRMTLRVFFESQNGVSGSIKADSIGTRAAEKLPPPKRD